MATKKSTVKAVSKAEKKSVRVPHHRTFLGFVFVFVILLVLSFFHFAVGYSAGHAEASAAAQDTLENIQARWQGLKAAGAVARGADSTSRLTGVIRDVMGKSLVIEADPVRFELFGDEPRFRSVLLAPTANFVDIAADGSSIRASQVLKPGDRVIVYASSNIRTSEHFVAGRVERYSVSEK